MKILVFSWRDPKHPFAGGAEQVMHEHMKGWVDGGNNVTLFSSKFINSKREEVLDGVQIVRGGYQYIGVQVAGFFYYLKNKKRFDFVVDQFHGLPFFTPLYVAKLKLAVIQETARKVWFLNPLPWPMNWIIGAIGYIFEPFIFLFYKNVPFMTGSESAKKDLSKFGIPKKNITIVPHGVIVDKSKIKNGNSFGVQKSKIKTIVYLGVLSKDKGIEDAIKCFKILDKMGKFRFWVIGKPETERYFNRLKNMVEELGLSGKVRFCGYVSQKKKFQLLSRAHVLVNPSVHEGWGLVNIEANSVGTPVVSYRASGLVDSVKDGISGILCHENTPESLAENVTHLLSDNKGYKRLKKGAISWSKNFSWEKSIKLSLNLIKQIAG